MERTIGDQEVRGGRTRTFEDHGVLEMDIKTVQHVFGQVSPTTVLSTTVTLGSERTTILRISITLSENEFNTPLQLVRYTLAR